MLAGLTLYFSANFKTVSFFNKGELSEPRGEYAVTTMPFETQYSTTSSWGQEGWSSIWFTAGTMRASGRRRSRNLTEKLETPKSGNEYATQKVS